MKLLFKKTLSLGGGKTAFANTIVDVPESLASMALTERAKVVFPYDENNPEHKEIFEKQVASGKNK